MGEGVGEGGGREGGSGVWEGEGVTQLNYF